MKSKKSEDVGPDHFAWLVEFRSRNHGSALEIYGIIEAHERVLSRHALYHQAARQLVAVAFSLWRAVFLSDLTGISGDQLDDLKKFLRTLMAHNAILYQTDFSSREWTFEYYLDNALLRLLAMEDARPAKGIIDERPVPETAKDSWVQAQERLDQLIEIFRQSLEDYNTSKETVLD